MITVLGATGNVGDRLVRRLLAAGEEVRAVGRNPQRLAGLAAAGAEIAAGEVTDAAFLTRAFTGADAVHTMLPYDPTASGFREQQERIGTAITTAIRDSGVRRVVALSSLGADRPSGTGFIAASLYPQEQRLRALPGVDVLFLRPGLFFESIVAALDVVRAIGINVDAADPDAPIPMIASRDVADAAAEALLARDWTGTEVRELLGPCDLTYTRATRILGAAIGRPDLQYVRLPDDEMVAALVEAGFTPETAALHVEMGRAMSTGMIASREGRTPRTTTPTRFEDVVSALLPDAEENP